MIECLTRCIEEVHNTRIDKPRTKQTNLEGWVTGIKKGMEDDAREVVNQSDTRDLEVTREIPQVRSVVGVHHRRRRRSWKAV